MARELSSAKFKKLSRAERIAVNEAVDKLLPMLRKLSPVALRWVLLELGVRGSRKKSRERLLRFVENVQQEANELAKKKGLSDWAESAWWRCITDAPAGTVIGPPEPSDELLDIMWLMIHVDLMRSEIARGRLEEAVMAAYDVGRGGQLVGLRAGRKEGGRASGETRRGVRLVLEALVPKLYDKFHREDPGAKEKIKYGRIRAELRAVHNFKTGFSDRSLRDILNNPSK